MSAAEDYIKGSYEGMLLQQDANVQTWHLNSPDSRWDVDMEEGKITFSFPEKIVTADVQAVGTLHAGTFLWGWDHPSVPEPLRHAAQLAKNWGEENNVQDFIQRQVEATEERAWEFTAVASRLVNASGTYRGDIGGTLVYMTFGALTMIGRNS